jgi:hypothetical protein
MGYSTDFYLHLRDPITLDRIVPDESDVDRTINAFTSTSGYFPKWSGNGWGYVGEWNWYDWRPELAEASRLLPHVLELHGYGEDHDDEWVAYAYRGRIQEQGRPKWVPAPPDPAILGPLTPVPAPPPRVEALREALMALHHPDSCPFSGQPSSTVAIESWRGGSGITCTCKCIVIYRLIQEYEAHEGAATDA